MVKTSSGSGAPRVAEAIRIREARPEEYGTILDVTRAAYEQYASDMPAETWDGYLVNMAETIVQDASAQRIVAERDGAIVASVLLFPAGAQGRDEPMIRLLAVTPQARGQGIGRALMLDCLRRAREAGAASVILHTTPMMAIAQRLYERMGFVRATELDFRPDAEDHPNVTVMGYRIDLR
jgi:predicted N-acetyltransferase YhbS